jgi:hypothetical protein
MMRKILIPVLILLMVTLACSVGGIKNPLKETLITPTAEPTNTPVPEEQTQSSIYDDFTEADPAWSDLYVVTTQAQPGSMLSKVSTSAGKMVFDIQDTETYVYKFYENPSKPDVVVEAMVQGVGQQMNGMALVCRAKNDYSAWYEFRVNGLSQYFLYRFDVGQRDSGKNPYILLQQGGLRKDYFAPVQDNVIRATCQGSDLTLEVNGHAITTVTDGILTDAGLVGVGAMSSTLLPVSVRFDYLSYGQPE